MDIPKIENPFDLEQQFEFYLNIMKLDKAKMPEVQIVETKRAFMAGVGQMLALAQSKISQLDEEEAINTLEDMYKQVDTFFEEEVGKLEEVPKLTIVKGKK